MPIPAVSIRLLHVSFRMRLLLTADLHCNPAWYRWLETEAGQYECVAIAGDLLDLFSSLSPKEQAVRTSAFLCRLATRTNVAVCSGNHDAIDYPFNARVSAPLWLSELQNVDGLVSDGVTRTIEAKLIVTTIPFTDNAVAKNELLSAGQARRHETGLPWLVLHHIPPPWHNNIDPDEARAGELLGAFQPDFWHSGHEHQLPYALRGGWCRSRGRTILLNAGQRLEARFPNHIVLELETRAARWFVER